MCLVIIHLLISNCFFNLGLRLSAFSLRSPLASFNDHLLGAAELDHAVSLACLDSLLQFPLELTHKVEVSTELLIKLEDAGFAT